MDANSNQEDMIQTSPVFKSLLMPDLLLGGEKFLVAPLAAVILMLIVYGQTWMSAIFAAILFFSILPLIRKMSRADPQLMGVYQRSRKKQSFYDAHSSYHIHATYGRAYNVKPKE